MKPRRPPYQNHHSPLTTRMFRTRVWLVIVAFLLLAIVGIGRGYQLQVVQHETLDRFSRQQNMRSVTTKGRRGSITDRNGNVLALSRLAHSLYAHPPEIADPNQLAKRLSTILNMPVRTLRLILTEKRQFVWIKRQVTLAEASAFEQLKARGLGSMQEYKRAYPALAVGGVLMGFVGIDGQGLSGLEYAYDSHLKGHEQTRLLVRGAKGKLILSQNLQTPTTGGDIQLTLDSYLQQLAETEMQTIVKDSQAKIGMALILDTASAEILAMAQVPLIDPNYYQHNHPNQYANQLITGGYEPGSTMKVLTAAIALEHRFVDMDDEIFCEKGRWIHYDSVIHDVTPYATLDLPNIIARSSNICSAKIGLRIPREIFYHHLKNFGFGYAVGIFKGSNSQKLASEATGYLLASHEWTPVDHAAISFGHGILVSPLQMGLAINTLANQGRYVPARLIKRYVDNRLSTKPAPLQKSRKVLSASTVQKMVSLMEQVTSSRKGTGYRAALTGYRVAGKTGTTEVYDIEAKGYSKTRHIASFAGFLPAQNPRLTILVVVVEPKRLRYGGQSAATAFRRIAEGSLPYLGIWPDNTTATASP